MPPHHLIESYLNDLRALPTDVVDELTDGLIETYDHHRAHGRAPEDAARTAINEFGPTEQIIAAFDRITPARRIARMLLATGPFAGLCWATAVITGQAWTWPIPVWTPLALACALVTIIALLLMATRTRHPHRVASIGAGGLILLDTLAIAGALAIAPAMHWALRLAILTSLSRACLTARALPRVRTR